MFGGDEQISIPVILSPPFRKESGAAWTVQIDSGLFPLTDDVGFVTRSILALREGDRLLGPGHASHDEIRTKGNGRYSHWRDVLYFSTSDNSDPNTNGRVYTVEPSETVYFSERVNYALSIVEFYATHVQGGLNGFRDRLVLEIGPGPDMGSVLAMACLGARVCVVDRYLASWRAGWHDKYLPVLIEEMRKRGWPVDPQPVERSLAAQAFDPELIRPVPLSLEDVTAADLGTGGELADLTVSHAAFEHFYAMKPALLSLARCMKPGGRGVHRVDFRDHRNFARPLEFLLLSQDGYDELSGDAKYQHGNRMRPNVMEALFRTIDFATVDFLPEATVDQDYFAEFLPRLRAATDSPFRDIDPALLSTLGGIFLIVR